MDELMVKHYINEVDISPLIYEPFMNIFKSNNFVSVNKNGGIR